MAGKHGGARPGAGQKKKTTVEQQLTRRDVVLDVFSVEELRECLVVWLTQIKGGAIEKLYPLLPYLLGSPKQEIAVTFDVQQTAQELAEKYNTTPEHVISIVERLKAKQAS